MNQLRYGKNVPKYHGQEMMEFVANAKFEDLPADFVCPILYGSYGHPIIKKDVCHQGNMNLFFDLGQSLRRLPGGNRTPNNLAARLLQPKDLGPRSLHIFRRGISH